MSENTTQSAVPPAPDAPTEQPAFTFTPAAGFPPANLPTLYADGIASIAPGLHVVKFYFARVASETSGTNQYANQVVCQVIMPIDGFVASIVFLDHVLKNMVENKAIDGTIVENARALLNEKLAT
jgi:hypothetical protein